jgi:mannose-6-phosphate isomerase-like protein (cupin superfamily)
MESRRDAGAAGGRDLTAAPAPRSLRDTAAALGEYWRPALVGTLNGQAVKVVRLKGDFIWHSHPDEDELFLVLEGTLRIAFRPPDAPEFTRTIRPGEFLIVPRGLAHRPSADDDVLVALVEPLGTRNTGDQVDPVFTAPHTDRPLEPLTRTTP